MRALPFLLLLAACPMPKDDDDEEDEDEESDADTDADTDADVDTSTFFDHDSGDTGDTEGGIPLIFSTQGDCALGECVWTIEASADVGTVELALVETGDAAFEEGCDGEVEAGGIACGVWSEFHNDFQLIDADNGYGGDTKRIALDIVTDYTAQVQNRTTLFDLDAGSTASQLTVMWVITDDRGNYGDCATYGHRPEYFRDYCANVW
jgi:hypothetical protein